MVLLIDGRAGCGKTTLANALAQQHAAQLVHMDDLTPGWSGLGAASAQLVRLLETGTAQRYNWVTQQHGELLSIDVSQPVIVEGCGSITAESMRFATHALWIECDAELRFERAIARDGSLFAPFWREWAEQEEIHIQQNRPHDLAQVHYRSERAESEQDKLLRCSQLLFSSQVAAATSEQFSKPAREANSTLRSSPSEQTIRPQG